MKSVLYITNIPSPYRVKYFEELGKETELTVVFETKESSERDSSWKSENFSNFKALFAKGIKIGVDHAFSIMPISVIRRHKKDEIIITNNMSLSGLFEIMYLKLFKIPFGIEADGAFIDEDESAIKAAIKSFTIKGAEKYYSPCENLDKYFKKYGADPNRIVRYPFSSVSNKDIRTISQAEKVNSRKNLNISETNVIVSVGQFIYRKGFDVLIDSMKEVDGNIGVYIIGGDELPFEYQDHRIHTVDFVLPEERDEYFAAADLFVLPTREDAWGLVVNEAMAKGLPVISTDRCNAALEMINDGENGYIVSSDNSEELSNRIIRFFELPLIEKSKMSNNAYETAKKWTIENMVHSHMV